MTDLLTDIEYIFNYFGFEGKFDDSCVFELPYNRLRVTRSFADCGNYAPNFFYSKKTKLIDLIKFAEFINKLGKLEKEFDFLNQVGERNLHND